MAASPPLPGKLPADDYDMHDSPEDLGRGWPLLGDPLQVCAAAIEPPFREADKAALDHQKRHRQLTTLGCHVRDLQAVLIAILQLGWPSLRHIPGMGIIELAFAAIAVGAVVLGIQSSRQANWLLERHKAERLRLAKFRFLIDSATWSPDAVVVAQQVAQLRAARSRISSFLRQATCTSGS